MDWKNQYFKVNPSGVPITADHPSKADFDKLAKMMDECDIAPVPCHFDGTPFAAVYQPAPETLVAKLARHFPPIGPDGLLPEGWNQ